MRLDHRARLEHLLDRHSDVTVVGEGERQTLARRDEVLVSARDLTSVEDRVRRWHEGTEPHDDLGIARLRLRPEARVDVAELASEASGPTRRYRRAGVSPNHLVGGQPFSWGGPADVPAVPSAAVPGPRPTPGGRDVTVAVLDTGIASHPWFAGTDWFGECHDVEDELDTDLDYQLDHEAGHGTFVAGVLLREAPSARLRVRRVLDSGGVGDELGVVRALYDVAAESRRRGEVLDVVNLSLGCYTYDDKPSPAIADAVARLGRRTVIVACAGNHGDDRPFWPAALKQVVAVGALDPDGDDRAEFSNFGWWVDACAVGEQVASSFVRFDGDRTAVRGADPDLFEGYAVWSGTSFSAPVVAGRIAALAADKHLSAADAADLLLDPAATRAMPDLGVVVDRVGADEAGAGAKDA